MFGFGGFSMTYPVVRTQITQSLVICEKGSPCLAPPSGSHPGLSLDPVTILSLVAFVPPDLSLLRSWVKGFHATSWTLLSCSMFDSKREWTRCPPVGLSRLSRGLPLPGN